jgi:hypothetical protein
MNRDRIAPLPGVPERSQRREVVAHTLEFVFHPLNSISSAIKEIGVAAGVQSLTQTPLQTPTDQIEY